ncbi:hypothetical protein J132_06808, partial [Termitomyces sp. J132]
EVKVGKIEGLLSLLAIELLGCPEVFEVLVICPDLKLVPCTFQKVPPLLEQPDDGQHLLVMDLIVLLYCIQALGVKRPLDATFHSLVKLILLPRHKWVDLIAGGCGIWQQLNGMVPPLVLFSELLGCSFSSKHLAQPLGCGLASPDLHDGGQQVYSGSIDLVPHFYRFIQKLQLVYATKLLSTLLLQSSTNALVVLIEGLSMRECQRCPPQHR